VLCCGGPQLVAKGSKLKVISNFGAGYDTVDVKAATEVLFSLSLRYAAMRPTVYLLTSLVGGAGTICSGTFGCATLRERSPTQRPTSPSTSSWRPVEGDATPSFLQVHITLTLCGDACACACACAVVRVRWCVCGCRRATEAERFLRDGSWERQGSDILAFWGNNPEGKTLGIIGYTHKISPLCLPGSSCWSCERSGIFEHSS
jgi:hypothetical protein